MALASPPDRVTISVRWFVHCLPLVVFACCANLAAETSLSARVETLVAPLVAANQFSGAIVLSKEGLVVYQKGFGMANRSAGLGFTPDTPADGGSMAKTFTAAGIWWLVQEGRVNLDAPVKQYVPGYPHVQTTVRQLLSHSNGLPPYYEFFDPYFTSDEVRTTEALLRVVAQQAPAPRFEPGARFEYSNLGFDAAALVIESVTGQGYESFLQSRFFERLGMKNTFARPARLADWKGVRTLGYRWQDNDWQLFDVFDMEYFFGASNLYFSAVDLGLWASANAAGTAIPADVQEAGEHRSLIAGKPSAINALSWYCDDAGERCYYTGDLNAFHSLVYWDRRRNESVALISNSSMPPWEIITLQRGLVAALAGLPLPPDPSVTFTSFTPDTLAAASGAYRAEEIGVAKVEEGAAGLTMVVDSGLTYDMFLVSGEVFYVPGLDYFVTFSGGDLPDTMHVRSMFADAKLVRIPDPPVSREQ